MRSRSPTCCASPTAILPASATCPAEELEFIGAAKPLQTVWVALRSSMRSVLEEVTLADVVGDELPPHVLAMAEYPDAWVSH